MALRISAPTPKLDDYIRRGHATVPGWVSLEDFELFLLLDSFQKAHNVCGHVCEIGAYSGKRFICFCLCLRDGETAVAIDPFEGEAGPGGEEAFRKNVQRHVGSTDALRVIRAGSSTIGPEQIMAQAGGAIRIFSIDGGHTAELVENDLELACRTLADGGVIILDDYFNEAFPGVSEGTVRYFASHPATMAPFAVFSTKVFFSQSKYAAGYKSQLRSEVGGVFRFTEAKFLSFDAISLRIHPPVTLAMRLVGTRVWRRLGSPVLQKLRHVATGT